MNPVRPSIAPDCPEGALVASKETPRRALRILVVDDDARARTVIAAGLRGDGHDVHTANDGPQALSLHARDPFDAVIADLIMPGISGQDLASGIKRLNPRTPVICVTGHLQELPDSPFDLIIRKPFPHPVLRAALDMFCA